MERTSLKRDWDGAADQLDNEFQPQSRRREHSQRLIESMTINGILNHGPPQALSVSEKRKEFTVESAKSFESDSWSYPYSQTALLISPIDINSPETNSKTYTPIPCPKDRDVSGLLTPYSRYDNTGSYASSVSSYASRSGTPYRDNDTIEHSPGSLSGSVQNEIPVSPGLLAGMEKVILNESCQMEIDDEEICYGMIIAYAQCCRSDTEDMTLIIRKLQHDSPEIEACESNYYTLKSSNHDEPFAMIDTLTGELLDHLMHLPQFKSLRFQVDLSCTAASTGNSDYGKCGNDKLPIFSININIYGFRSVMDQVGKELGTKKAYLQQPSYIDPGVDYDNPHYFKPRGQKTPWVNYDNVELENSTVTMSDQMAGLLHNVLDCQLTRGDGLIEVGVDPRIKTPLLRHQRQALDFIIHRESGIMQDGYSLWKPTGNIDSRFRYCNLLDGAQQCHTPWEARGGILADEVGLGKTLTMISTVAGSLGEATQFAHLSSGRPLETLPHVKSTLIILPLNLLAQWGEQIQMHTVNGSLKYYMYHGSSSNSESSPAHFSEYDIILTTYAKVYSDFSRGHKRGLLYAQSWFRIIVDEAHQIRNTQSKQFRAICSLSAQRRWCLTATPIQNSLEDLGALFQFLKVEPVNTKKLFKKHIIDSLKFTDQLVDSASNLRLLLTTYCLRRRQSTLAHCYNPEINEIVRRVDMSGEERRNYDMLKRECKSAIDNTVRKVARQKYFSMLDIILRLRLFCNNGVRDLSPIDMGASNCTYCGGQVDLYTRSESPIAEPALPSSHLICLNCSGRDAELGYLNYEKPKNYDCAIGQQSPLKEQLEDQGRGSPGSLRGYSSYIFQQPPTVPDLSMAPQTSQLYPGKIIALLQDIKNNPRNEKSIVFSSWVRSLEIVERGLRDQGIGYVLIEGRLNLAERQRNMHKFREVPEVMVLLMTTGTGAAGLNLTIASRVYLLEPQWNPMVEVQAIGRVARLGQTRPVTIYRYIMALTIEENVQARQAKKISMADIAMNLETDSNTKRQGFTKRLMDLKSLISDNQEGG